MFLEEQPYIPIEKRKKILLLSDDMRFFSGIATVSRELVIGTSNHINWVQLGAAARHPDEGKVFDISQNIKSEFKTDASVKIYCTSGYGDPVKLRELINIEQPDAILHFTDPRYWEWLYAMENEVRTNIPIMYLNIWDDLPDPQYNEGAYASCDLLFSISKQTYGINNRVLKRFNHPTIEDRELNSIDNLNSATVLSYLPHGINSKSFYPVSDDEDYDKYKAPFKDDDFIIFWNNRNIYRKQVSTVITAFDYFVNKVRETLGDEQADKIRLVLHTQPIEEAGTNIYAVIQALTPKSRITISSEPLDTKYMNYLYNIADVTINITSNEGFGISTAESLMAGTPIIVNVTGGLQDQAGFINPETNDYYTCEDYVEIGSLHAKTETHELQCGDWVMPIFPTNRSLQGSVPTPYIFDDRVDYEDVAAAFSYYYNMSKDELKGRGLAGRDFMLNDKSLLSSENMCNKFINVFSSFITKWTPSDKFKLIDTEIDTRHQYVGDTLLHTNRNEQYIINNIKQKGA